VISSVVTRQEKLPALSLCEKCLAAPQLFLAFRDSTRIVGRFRLFARRDVLESHQNPAL
jgi:hypothetical protein